MTRNIFIFLATFVVGATIALATRAALFNPSKGHEGHPLANDYAPMVTNDLTPATKQDPASLNTSPKGDPHAGHSAHVSPDSADKPVNTVCAICGMGVDPSVPTAKYQGKTIGFGCRMCPPKFKADPDKYGPYYLRNETFKQ